MLILICFSRLTSIPLSIQHQDKVTRARQTEPNVIGAHKYTQQCRKCKTVLYLYDEESRYPKL
jgi:hypothetical protein